MYEKPSDQKVLHCSQVFLHKNFLLLILLLIFDARFFGIGYINFGIGYRVLDLKSVSKNIFSIGYINDITASFIHELLSELILKKKPNPLFISIPTCVSEQKKIDTLPM